MTTSDDKTLVERLDRYLGMHDDAADGDGMIVPVGLARELNARIEALEAEADAWNRKAVAAMEERNAALAQVAAAFWAAAQIAFRDRNGSAIGYRIRAATSADASAAYDAALRKARAEGMRDAAEIVASKARRREYTDEALGTIIGRSLIDPDGLTRVILARVEQIEKGET